LHRVWRRLLLQSRAPTPAFGSAGRARFEYQYTSTQRRLRDACPASAPSGRLNIDARTQTAYGALRAFVRFDIMSRTGAYQTSGTRSATP
jgi:hypothetical protein